MKTAFWAICLMAASVLLAVGCGGKGSYVPQFDSDAPCHPTVKLQISTDTNQLSLVPGEEKDIAVTVRNLNGAQTKERTSSEGEVVLKVEGQIPKGVSVSVRPANVVPTQEGAVSYLTVDASSAAEAGTFSISVVGTIGSCVQSRPIQVSINLPTEPFSIQPDFSAVSVPRGGTIDLPFRVTSRQTATVSGRVPFTFSLNGPVVVNHTFSVTPTDITPTASGVEVILHLRVLSSTPAGLHTLVLWANNGSHNSGAEFSILVTESEPS